MRSVGARDRSRRSLARWAGWCVMAYDGRWAEPDRGDAQLLGPDHGGPPDGWHKGTGRLGV